MRCRKRLPQIFSFQFEILETRLVMSANSSMIEPPALIGSVEAGCVPFSSDANSVEQADAGSVRREGLGAAIRLFAAPAEAPELTTSINKAVFTVKAPAMVIDSALQVTDADSPDFSDGQLTVSIISGSKTDKLGIFSLFGGAGQVSVKKTTVKYEDTPVATFTGGKSGKPLVVTFNANATLEAVQAVTRAVTFSTTDKKVTATRTVQFQMTDGDGGSSEPVTVDVSLELLANRGKGPAVFGGTDGRSDDLSGGLDDETRRRAEQLTNAFEHSTVDLPTFDTIHFDDDGRGLTAGFAGFTTGTGDLLEVVQKYTSIFPDNPLAKFIPQLEKLVGTNSVKGLAGIEAAWRTAALDPHFESVQYEVNDANSYVPAIQSWHALGLTSNLSLAALYDAAIQHGPGQESDDPGYADGLAVMIDRASARAGGTPAEGVEEANWLSNFLQVRRESLAYATFKDTRKAWADAVERVDVYRQLLADGNLDLNDPIKFHVYGDEFTTK